jgi:hypothetical protein
MKLVQLPGTHVAVNPRWVTCVVDNQTAVDFHKEPWPHVTVHWCYGVQQGQAHIKDVPFAEVVALINEGAQ